VTEETYTRGSVQDNLARMVFDRAVEIFGDNIANPEQEPIRFGYQMRVVEFSFKRDNLIKGERNGSI